MSDDIRTEARSLLDGLPSWGDGANWCDPSGQSIPIPKVTLRRLLHYILTDVDQVRADALREAASICDRRSDELAARPQGPDWQSVEFTTAANEIRRLAEGLRPRHE